MQGTEASVFLSPIILKSGGSKSNKGEKKNTSSKKSKKALSNGDYPVMPKKLTLPHGFV